MKTIKAFILSTMLLCAIGAEAQVVLPQGRNVEFGLQAHRGIAARYPENSIISFKEAAKIPYYFGMETDVQMTKDGVLVCMHDNTIDRTTNGTGKVSDYTWSELRKLRLDGGYGWSDKYAGKLRVPTFEQYLKICKKANLVPYVELKLLTLEGVRKTIKTLHDMGFEGKYVLSSFHWSYLREAAKYTDAPLEFMASRKKWTDENLQSLKKIKSAVIRPAAKHLTQEFVDKCHSMGFVVECYGIKVGDAKMVAKLRKWGVKGGTCNDWQGLNLDK